MSPQFVEFQALFYFCIRVKWRYIQLSIASCRRVLCSPEASQPNCLIAPSISSIDYHLVLNARRHDRILGCRRRRGRMRTIAEPESGHHLGIRNNVIAIGLPTIVRVKTQTQGRHHVLVVARILVQNRIVIVIIVIVDHLRAGRSDEKAQRIVLDVQGRLVAVMCRLQVVLHFVGPRELFAAHRARKHLPLGALVVEKGVPLEAVLVLERLLDVFLGTFRALVDALADDRVPEQIEATHTHFGELFRGIVERAARLPPYSTAHYGARRMRRRSRHTGATLLLLLLLLLLQSGTDQRGTASRCGRHSRRGRSGYAGIGHCARITCI